MFRDKKDKDKRWRNIRRPPASPFFLTIFKNRIFGVIFVFGVYISQALCISHVEGYTSISEYIENNKTVTICVVSVMSALWILNEFEVHELYRASRVLLSAVYCSSVFLVLQFDLSTHRFEHYVSVLILAISMLLYQWVCVQMGRCLFKTSNGLHNIFIFNVAICSILAYKFFIEGKMILLEIVFLLGSGVFAFQRDRLCGVLLTDNRKEEATG
jgi:hypothetical protein